MPGLCCFRLYEETLEARQPLEKSKGLLGLALRERYHQLMPKRPSHQRSIKHGQFVDWPEGVPLPHDVAQRAVLRGNTEHKTYPSQFGPPANFSDKTKCDRYREENWPQLVEALRRAIESRALWVPSEATFPVGLGFGSMMSCMKRGWRTRNSDTIRASLSTRLTTHCRSIA